MQELRKLQYKYKDHKEFYTDGFKTGNHVGIGIVTTEETFTVGVWYGELY